ncbi:hypothetical protein HPB51_001901 [Rhipicephalus microplus]|uniref:SWIM-type domain-containing protein n=1 Tax=Rhipicephalus microplus TaxID=6941 RepID=A0A9J6DEB2_RHIMP|nr:hypothetical protein HPB51_001901 [Rhipicephalus microplus]
MRLNIVLKRPPAILHNFPGTHISVTRGGSSACWAVVVVTPIMRRAHNLELAREIVFVDSTASCDTTKCTVTVVLTVTKAGAVPLAVLIHKEQSTDGYLAAFKLLKEAHPLCFGGQSVMYADTAEKLEAATAEVKALQHEASVSRVRTFLRRLEEWVQLYCLDVLTKGHNTNNFEEATIRVLKDIILNRVEAFNAVALADSVALVWDKYFESRILRHAYRPVAAHQLLYKRLLSRMPKDAAEAIQVVGQGQYIVPSATHPSSSYEVYADIGLCTCLIGKQGAFCKHQASVQKKKLALGEKCPPRIFFEPFQEEEPSSSARTTEGTSAQQEEPDELQPMQGTSTHEATHVASVPSVPDAAQLTQAQEHAYEFLEFQLRRVHSMNAHNPAYLDIVEGLGEELARVQNSSDGTGLMLALKATTAARRRRARHIRVQPTSSARRRPGLTRGSKRVPTGRPAVEPAAKRAKKRPHSFSHNIEKSVPGARLH